MGVLTGIFVLVLVGILADTVTKLAKSRGDPALRAHLADLDQQLQDQAGLLADANAMIVTQSEQIQELAERVDFAERLLARGREPGAS